MLCRINRHGLGQGDAALKQIETGVDAAMSPTIESLIEYHAIDQLKTDSRFQSLVASQQGIQWLIAQMANTSP